MLESVLHVFGTLAPIYLILALGAWLRHVGFITASIASGLNRLVFYIALPCFIARSIAVAKIAGGWERDALALGGGTLVVFILAGFLAPAVGISKF